MRVRRWARSGDLVHVVGMVGRDPDGAPVDGTEAQIRRITDRIDDVLTEVGTTVASVVRLRVYLLDVQEWSSAAPVLDAWFGGKLPPTTVVGVVALVEPWMRVEVEVDADAPPIG